MLRKRNALKIAVLTLSISLLGSSFAFADSFVAGGAILNDADFGIAIGDGATAGSVVGTDQRDTAVGVNSAATNTNSSAFGAFATSTGSASVSVGAFAHATGTVSTAVGSSSQATLHASAAFGYSAIANGENATALGTGAIAVGPNTTSVGLSAHSHGSQLTAVGTNAGASGSLSVALGTDANGGGFESTAIGTISTAGGNRTTAVGSRATSQGNDTTAIGHAAYALGTRTTSAGAGSRASATGASAFGANAQATHANSTAVGLGAATTTDNQMMFGTTSNTYTLAGVSTAASRTAQTGGTKLVTADALGTLATIDLDLQSELNQLRADLSNVSVGNIANANAISALEARVTRIESLPSISRQLEASIRKLQSAASAGVAMSAVIQPDAPLSGDTNRLGFNVVTFDEKTAAGLNYIKTSGDFDFRLGVASSGDQSMAKAGVGFSW